MNKKTKFLLFLIGLSLLSCNSKKDPIIPISNMDTDFPVSEKLDFRPVNKFDVQKNGDYMIDSSTLWYFLPRGGQDVGYCYDLNTAEKVSIIATIGRAANEFIDVYAPNCKMAGDSIQIFSDARVGIKTFAKRDIIENVPIGERAFSVAKIPAHINLCRAIKLPNGSLLATIWGYVNGYNPTPEQYEINSNTVAIIDENEEKGYKTIDYGSFELNMTARELEFHDQEYMIKNDYAKGDIEIKGNDKAAFSVLYQFILYTLDLNSGKVLKEKRYTNMQSSGVSHYTTNDLKLRMGLMESNDKYIFCPVFGYFSKEDKELNIVKRALFIFDWDLNPVKRFELPNVENCRYIISTDCRAIYQGIFSDEDGLTLTKADLNI